MKKFVKFLVAILVIAVVGVSAVTLAACDDSNVLYVATNAEFPPFESMNKKNKIVGFDVDFVNAIAENIGMKAKFKNMAFDSIIGTIQSKPNYIAVAGMTANDERREQVNFSKEYFDTYQVYIVKDSDESFNGVTTKAAADAVASSKKIYSANGQIGQFYVNGSEDMGYEKLACVESLSLNSVNDCLEKIELGKSIAIADKSVAQNICAAKGGYKIIDVKLTDEKYAIGINKGNTALLDKINAAIDTLIANGTIEALKLKWLSVGTENV